MKFSDLMYYLDKDLSISVAMKNITASQQLTIFLSKNLFLDIKNELCESNFEITNYFEYNEIKFKLDLDRDDYYAVICFNGNGFGYGYEILTEAERAIKNILE